jgi:YD repeat-containing protein
MNSKTAAARIVVSVTIALIVATPRLLALDDHNPIGVTGAFEGVITTGGAYNVLNHNATRQIDDIVVPGAIGKYGLKMSRYYNSRRETGYSLMGPGWSYEYLWSWDSNNGKAEYPNGNVWDSKCTDNGPLGVSDWPSQLNGNPTFRLADGGTVVFGAVVVNGTTYHSVATQIIDPYGQPTTITYYANTFLIYRVTEPGGRYLQFVYTQQPPPNGPAMLTRVEAHGLGNATVTDWVNYTYASKPTGGTIVTSAMCLTSVDYSDGQHASYTYTTDNVPEHPGPPCPCSIRTFPLVSGCDDARYHAPMRRIAYEYQAGPHGAILRERYWDGVAGHELNGEAVSRIDPPAPSPLITEVNFETTYTEYRGDGPTRTFTYTPLHLHRVVDETCPTASPAPQQFPLTYTDFQGHTTTLGYDVNWYVTSVRDANNHTTTYTRGPPPSGGGIGEILTITHPGGSHIDYTYDDHGHYVHSISNERQKITTYTRNPTTHLVTRIDYPSDNYTPASYEEFTYNNFGQILTHHLRNGAYESFAYNSRGLLTDKYNPGGNGSHAHYDYYTASDGKPGWIDRVKTMTLPANVSGNVATETYEYDRVLDGNGITNLNGAAVPGRGLVTKISHRDGKYQQFKYDAYGNKRWEDNELRKPTSYTYDDYNRLLTVTRPLNGITIYTYNPTNGTGSPYKHTTNNPDTITTATNIVTRNVYDENFRKVSTAVGSSTTTFGYDNVGNPTTVTDPLIHTTTTTYDERNRKATVTDALNRTMTFTYDGASNVVSILRPDTYTETKAYDAMNRLISHTVPKSAGVNLTTWFAYNPSGTIQKVTDARGSGRGDPNYTTTFEYNASDEKTKMTYPDGSFQFWAYDDAHNLASRRTVHGEIQSFTYDIRNRKVGMTWNNNADSATYGYDDVGRLTSAANPNSTVTRQYDDAGRLTLDQQNVSGLATVSVNYGYDADGKENHLWVPGANPSYDYTYGYDAMGRFETITPSGGSVAFQYYYDAASNETRRHNYLSSPQLDQFYNRDNLNRIWRLEVKKGATSLGREDYGYDMMNRLISVTREDNKQDQFGYYRDGELNWVLYGTSPTPPLPLLRNLSDAEGKKGSG